MYHLLVRHKVADYASSDVPEAQASSGVLDTPDIYLLSDA